MLNNRHDRCREPISSGDRYPPAPSCGLRWNDAVAQSAARFLPGVESNLGALLLGERFNSRLRAELLTAEIFYGLEEAKVIIEAWCKHYNTKRPHSSLGYQPPAPDALIWAAPNPGSASPATPTLAPRPVMKTSLAAMATLDDARGLR